MSTFGFWTRRLSSSLRLALLLGLTGPVGAQEVRIRCHPSEVQVYLRRPGYADTLLGSAEETLPLPAGAVVDGKVKLRLSLPGTAEKLLEVPPGVYPPPSEPALELGSPSRLPWLLGALALVGGGLAWWQGNRSRSARGESGRPLLGLPTVKMPIEDIRVGPYRLGERLGQGATATVFRARNPEGRPVALKLLDPQVSSSPEHRARFEREVKICQQARHPNLVELLDHGMHEDILYLVYPLLEGTDLRAAAGANWRTCARRVAAALEAVQTLHDLGICHRDLKPENLFLCQDGSLVVVDLGVARGEEMTAATATGMVVGTPHYMAPEQVQGEFALASDQYALGTVLYELLTGRTPFEEKGALEQAIARLERAAPALDAEALGIPVELAQAVARMLAIQPGQRFPSVAAAAAELRRLAG